MSKITLPSPVTFQPQAPQLVVDRRLEASGIYLLHKEISQESCSELMRYIFEANLDDTRKFENIQLIINSPGGDMHSTFGVCDVIQGSMIPVYTLGIGLIASAALLLFMTGKRGHRVITPNTAILSHQWTTGYFGKEHELLAQVKEYDLLNVRMINHYKKYTGLSEKKIKQYLLPPTDMWLSAKEAVQLHIADKIVEPKVKFREVLK